MSTVTGLGALLRADTTQGKLSSRERASVRSAMAQLERLTRQHKAQAEYLKQARAHIDNLLSVKPSSPVAGGVSYNARKWLQNRQIP